jgi:hypothetical protein
MDKIRYNVEITKEDKTIISDSIALVKSILVFGTNLTKAERKAMSKVAGKTHEFIMQALTFALLNEQVLPRSFNVSDMQKVVTLFADLKEIQLALKQLAEWVDDTIVAVGDEADALAREVYKIGNMGNANVAADDVMTDIGKRYARKPKAKPENPPAGSTP